MGLNSKGTQHIEQILCDTLSKALDWSREIIAAGMFLSFVYSTMFLIRCTLSCMVLPGMEQV